MKIIYFSLEYYCHHGARTHARSFFDALSRHPQVSKAILLPSHIENGLDTGGVTNSTQSFHSNNNHTFLFYTARMIWRICIPEWIQIQIKLFFPSPQIYQSISTAILNECPDAIILRIGGMFRLIHRLRKDFPSLKIYIEFNATGFDEMKIWIPGRDIWRREEARQLGFANSIFVVSDYLRRYLTTLNHTLQNRITVNPNGVDPKMFRPFGEDIRFKSRREMQIPDDAVVFGYVGGMESFRRLPEVVRQIATFRRNGLNRLFLAIIGTGTDSKKISDVIRECSQDLSGWIYFCNQWVEHERIPLIMSAFDVGLFPYTNPYVSPLKIIEYMSCGLPIVGPDVPGVTEQIDNEYLPFLIRQDGSNLDEVVRYVYINLELCKTMALRARELVKQEFTWDANTTRVVNTIIK